MNTYHYTLHDADKKLLDALRRTSAANVPADCEHYRRCVDHQHDRLKCTVGTIHVVPRAAALEYLISAISEAENEKETD